ncbi:hypothetical protein ACJ72_01090 [Emergomyces africanus]|uniref:NIMA-interacting protein TinC n=1 Tax=Emergomyces africanus TaxID=1955775 RepID=A0A1B7P685_9EURO|nr:hypothetical protein ACJ72_01090 [Emergomyces africanus]
MAWSTTTTVAATCLLVLLFSRPAHAFGAGNIASMSKIEGQNWRHGDIEDVILTLLMARSAGGEKFSKMNLKRIYFGNWLRDYSQAIDIGTVKYVSAEAIRLLLWVLGFMSFGYGTGEFEVTTERIGCYQPTEHIDNPLAMERVKTHAAIMHASGGPSTRRERLKNYISSEDLGIDTSAGLLRRVFGECIALGRRYSRSKREADLHEALRLLGTGLHTLEDYLAHSNYVELSLRELNENEIFPHVGRNTQIQLAGARHAVYPIVTGTFGGVDFLHSVMGEFSDKATQSEIQNLEGMIAESENQKPQEGFLQNLLDKIPDGLFGSEDSTGKMNEFKSNAESTKQRNQNISPRQPEEWAIYMSDVHQQMYPLLEWHDNLMKSINEAIERIPVLPDLIEQVQEQITVFVFSVMAPYVLPIIQQVKHELETGSSEVIQSSKDQQLNTFENPYCTDPTHSMLSKDHFSNVLNEPAGKAAAEVVRWVVPQIMACWDDESVDVDRTMNRIINGVLHHPALRNDGEDGAQAMRDIMFNVVRDWWEAQGYNGQDSLRRQLSEQGVRAGENHKAGVHDSGHGCGKPMGLPNRNRPVAGGALDMFGLEGLTAKSSKSKPSDFEKMASEAVGGGLIGSLVGGIVGGATGGALGERDDGKRHKEKKEHRSDPHQYSSHDKGKDYEHEEKKKKKKDKEKSDKDDKEWKKDKKDKKADKDKKYKEDKKISKKYDDYGDNDREDDGDDYERKKEKKEKKEKKDKKHHGDERYGRDEYQSGGNRQTQFAETTSSYGHGEQRYDTGISGGYAAGVPGGRSEGYGGGEARGYGTESRGYGESESRGYGGGYGGESRGETRGYGESEFQGGYGGRRADYGTESRGYGESESRGHGGESRGGYDRQQEHETSSSHHHGHRERSGSRERTSRRYESGHYGGDERRHGSRDRSHDRKGDDDGDDDNYRRRYGKKMTMITTMMVVTMAMERSINISISITDVILKRFMFMATMLFLRHGWFDKEY